MNRADITAAFVQARYRDLQDRWSERNDRMDDYERMYLLDLWDEGPDPDEVRITVPTAFETVEQSRTLLLARPPIITVPPSDVTAVDTDQADKLEKFLYGAWDMAKVPDALDGAEWGASCLGEGVLRVFYDDGALENEFPLIVQSPDPRNVYPAPSGRPGIDSEIIHAFKRPRREIEEELEGRWAVRLWHTIKRGEAEGPYVWARELENAPGDPAARERWLDEEVDYIDYWRVDVVTEKAKERPKPKVPLGPLGLLLRVAGKALGFEPREAAQPVVVEGGEETRPSEEGPSEPGEPVRRRAVTHCIVVENQMVKKPVRVPGYRRIPFIRYPGIKTPLKNENGALSVLFPISGGSRENGAIGVAAAEAQAVAMRQRIVEMYATGAVVTDDKSLAKLDFKPEAINYIGEDKRLEFLVPPGPLPAADAHVELMRQYIEDATFPAVMRGRYVGDLSGIALSALTNPVLMRVGARQQIRERAYELLNQTMLELAEQYAVDGWEVWGHDRNGKLFELELRAEDVGGYYRNEVKLSASLPKDEAGEVLSLAQLVQNRLISRETFLERLQQIKSLESQSPQDEMKRILRDVMLFEGPTAERLAEVVLQEFSPALAEMVQPQPQPQPQPQMAMPQPQAPMPPQAMPPGMPPGQAPPVPPAGPPGVPSGPMQGMPPSAVPPQAMPEALARLGPEGIRALLRMRGTPAPGVPPVRR